MTAIHHSAAALALAALLGLAAPGAPAAAEMAPQTAAAPEKGAPLPMGKPQRTAVPLAKALAPAPASLRSSSGDRGPESRGGLCADGAQQSPIDIRDAGAAKLPPLTFHYKLSLVELSAAARSVTGKYGAGSYLTLGETRYDLVDIAFHAPGEHTVAGRRFPLEIQLMHRDPGGRRLAVSVLGTLGGENLAAREVVERLPDRPGGKIADPRVLMNARDLLPETRRYYRYVGSLTAPPCTEGIDRIVLGAPMTLSADQIARIRQATGGHARPVQARRGRYLMQAVGG